MQKKSEPRGYASSQILSCFPSCKACFNRNDQCILGRLEELIAVDPVEDIVRRTFSYGMYLVLLMTGPISKLHIKISSFLLPFKCSYSLLPRLMNLGSSCTHSHASTLLSTYFASYVQDVHVPICKNSDGDTLPFCF